MDDNQPEMEETQKTAEVETPTLDDNHQTIEDNQNIIEDKQQPLEDNLQTLEDNHNKNKDKEQTLENNHQTMEDNKQIDNSVYTCDECGKFFTEKQKLVNHKTYAHRIKVSVCQICGKEFQNKQKLQKHVIARHNNKEMHCDMCVKVFKNNSDLYGHKKKVHEVTENLSCSGCGTKMMNAFKLKRHMKKCRGSRSTQDNLNCNLCNLTFESNKSLNGHNKFVHSDDPVKCPICQWDSKNISSFRQHLNRAHKIIDHKNILSLIKDVMPEFEEVIRKKRIDNSSDDKNPQDSPNLSEYQKQRSDLVKKWKEIEKERNEKITAQKIKFEKVSKMEKSSDDLFTKKNRPQCVDCGKLFKKTDKLNSHIKLMHTYEPCTCPFCGSKTLKNKSYLAKHIKKVHKDFQTAKQDINIFNEEEKIKMNEVLMTESHINFPETKQNKRIDVKQEIFETSEIFEPSSCPICEGTILKNKTYLAKHLEQFHKEYNLLEEKTSILQEEEEIKISPDILNLKLEVSDELGMWKNETYKGKHDADKEFPKQKVNKKTDKFVKKETRDDADKISNNSDEKSFHCNDCPKTFTTKGGVNYHKLSHTNEKPFMCEICSQTFTTKWHCEQHKLIHTGEKPFQCSDCGQTFRLKEFMKSHKKNSHSNEKPFMCDICSQAFITKTKLVQHKLIHTGEKPFQCDECEASFRLKFVMKKHKKKIHGAGKNSIICKICSKTFRFPGMLEAHERGHANGDSPSTCSLCNATFLNATKLKWHKRMHNRNDIIDILCQQCGKSFKSTVALGGHVASSHTIRKQQGVCLVCDREFTNSANLRRHLIMHNEQSSTSVFECQECNKGFEKRHDLYVHNYSTHTIQNIACPSCGKTCKNKVALNKHIKRTCSSLREQSGFEQTFQAN